MMTSELDGLLWSVHAHPEEFVRKTAGPRKTLHQIGESSGACEC